MLGTPTETQVPPLDSSRSALDFVHRLFLSTGKEYSSPAELLRALADAFVAPGAGLASFPDGVPLSIHPLAPGVPLGEGFPPWQEQPDWIDHLCRAHLALTMPRRAGGSCLATVLGTPQRGGWLLWLEDGARSQWTDGEASLLAIAGQALTHHLTDDETLPGWAVALDRGSRREHLDAAAAVVRRLAHDFGNILTGILGFSELGLAQQFSVNSPLHDYLTEIHRGALHGAEYVNQLRTFARRRATSTRTCPVVAVLNEEEKRLRPLLGADIHFHLDCPSDLPLAAIDSESLRQALAIVFDNAREAIAGTGVIEVTVRSIRLNALEVGEVFGDVRAGDHLEIRVADSGVGLAPEVRRQLLREPFFSTKTRKRGFGLAMAYGILSAHRGGLDLLPRPEGGTIARLVLPAAVAENEDKRDVGDGKEDEICHAPCGGARSARPTLQPVQPQTTPRRERVLVVDDDPMVRQFVSATLERAGFRVQAVGSAEEALTSYCNADADPFRLVLSDVLMPEVNGIDLTQRLLARDANVRVLLMSGQTSADLMPPALAPGRVELLSKPFRPDGLVRAVRAAIAPTDRG
jgi:signal transduction histidine kinase/CheY-like chemotaxis protein